MTESDSKAGFQWGVIVTMISLGLLSVILTDEGRKIPSLMAGVSVVGGLVLILGASGLVVAAVQGKEPRAIHLIRWALVALVGALTMSPGWGTALAVAVVVFGLTWRGLGEQPN